MISSSDSTNDTAGNRGAASDLESRIRGKVEEWRKRLLDLGNRNPLINCQLNSSKGVIELLHPDCETVWKEIVAESDANSKVMRFPWKRDLVPPPSNEIKKIQSGSGLEVSSMDADKQNDKEWNPSLDNCLKSKRLQPLDILTPLGDKALDRRLRTLEGYANLAMSEQGVQSLFLVFGFLRWFESADSNEERISPIMLVPMSLSRRNADAPWELSEAEDDVLDNLCLRQRLKVDFGLELPSIPDLSELEESGARLKYLELFREAIRKNERWTVEDRCVLGRFAFPKIAMWKDIGDHMESVIQHPLCRTIAGDTSVPPVRVFGDPSTVPSAAQLDDSISPGEIKTILDSDSSQLEAIVAARKGLSFVLDGPPGTGKSQTIANIIADAISEGRKVLFVSEKIAALEVVKRRLDECGIGDFCLECHSSKVNRKIVLDELAYCLGLDVEVYDDSTPKLQQTKELRDKLNHYVRSIHQPRHPFGLSPYQLFGRISRLDRLGLTNKSRMAIPDPTKVDRRTFEKWLELLGKGKELSNVITGYSSHPWRGCRLEQLSLNLVDDIKYHFGLLRDSLRSIAESVAPLKNDRLIEDELTILSIPSIYSGLAKSKEVPEVPPQWFDDPIGFASAVIRWCESEKSALELRNSIQEYSESFFFAEVDWTGLLTDLDGNSGLASLIKWPLPESVRAQFSMLNSRRVNLAELLDRVAETEVSLDDLIEQLQLPVKKEIPSASISKLVTLSHAIAESGVMRQGWFDGDNRTKLRSLCTEALAELDTVEILAGEMSDEMVSSRIDSLGRLFAEQGASLRDSWSRIRIFAGTGNLRDLSRLAAWLESQILSVGEIRNDVRRICDLLRISASGVDSVTTARILSDAVKPISDQTFFHGAWRDPLVQKQVTEACAAAMEEVAELVRIKDDLQERMAYRAFRETSRELVAASTKYQSIVARLFGGLNKYRKSAAELYKGELPANKLFLTDLGKLHRFHAKSSAAQRIAEEIQGYLPQSHVSDSMESWGRVSTSLSRFGELASRLPIAVTAIPSETYPIDFQGLHRESARLDSYLSRLADLSQQNPGFTLIDETLEFDVLELYLKENLRAVLDCLAAWTTVAGIYSVPPDSFGLLLDDIDRAVRHLNSTSRIESIFHGLSDLLPHGASPSSREHWQRTLIGIDAAERLLGIIPKPEVLFNILCTEGRINFDALAVTADKLEISTKVLDVAITSAFEFWTLTGPDEAQSNPFRRSLSHLREIVRSSLDLCDIRIRGLQKCVCHLLQDQDVPVSRIPHDIRVAEEIRQIGKGMQEALEWLRSNGFSPSTGIRLFLKTATWLLPLAQGKQITPFVRAVASSGDVRSRVQKTCMTIKKVWDDRTIDSWKFVRSLFDPKNDVSSGIVLADAPLSGLADFLDDLSQKTDSLNEWVAFLRWQKDLTAAGFSEVLEEAKKESLQPDEIVDAVSSRFYRQLFDGYVAEDRFLENFSVDEHEETRKRFCENDEWEVKAAAVQIRQYQLGRADRPRSMDWISGNSELGILQREIQKKRKHLPLRKLFAQIPSVLQRLKPCVMMSPLSVSTFLQSDDIKFDLVIFDEASQVFPWDALVAIHRGSQVIVAGDEKQLPPTNFFSRAESEDENEEDDISDYESILSLCKSTNMPGKGLKWHYRSRRESLIAFSNHHFYGGELVTFPSIRDAVDGAIRLELVPEGRWIDRKNLEEANRVVDILIEHRKTKPSTSIGVIAFNSSQQTAIEDVLYDRRRSNPKIDRLFGSSLTEPLFIKNLENVQGDERDVILLSMAYGFNEAGKFLKNFGPLSKSGGERRLNVAVTRAREGIVFVASVRAADMDLSGSTSQGAHLLKQYLDFAERGVGSIFKRVDDMVGEAESPFEQEVAEALMRHGLVPVHQVGCGGFRIDLALKHTERPGEFCLGIECDGATYHSSKTARDRDRIRQSVLESLGWRISRIWSTDWVRDPKRQIARILDDYEQSLLASEKRSGHLGRKQDGDLDLRPKVVKTKKTEVVRYDSIDDVPDDVIRSTVFDILTKQGATEVQDLINSVRQRLGFLRTGAKIYQRVFGLLQTELEKGSLRMIGDRIMISVDVDV